MEPFEDNQLHLTEPPTDLHFNPHVRPIRASNANRGPIPYPSGTDTTPHSHPSLLLTRLRSAGLYHPSTKTYSIPQITGSYRSFPPVQSMDLAKSVASVVVVVVEARPWFSVQRRLVSQFEGSINGHNRM